MPPYDATVVTRLREAGMPILGKTNLDEFAMGSSTEHSAYGPTRNPWDTDRTPGGSGGGSAAAVAARLAPLAIGTDTGGSIRQPGALTGTVGVKPTYGGVSRYGIVAMASSLDQAGPVTRTVLDAALLHEVIGGHDPMDSTSIDAPVPAVVDAARRGDVPGLRIGVVKELGGEGFQTGVQERFEESVALLTEAGATVVEVSCPSFDHALAAYYLVMPSEVSSNLARFDAMRYGLRVFPEGVDGPERRAGDGRDPRRRLRRRGEAPDHPRHLRPLQRLLRRLLRLGAEGPGAGGPRLRGGVRARPTCWSPRPRRRRRSGWGRSSTTRWRCTSRTSPPSPPTSPACPGSRSPAGSPRTGCRSASSSSRRCSADDRLYNAGAALERLLLEKWGGRR